MQSLGVATASPLQPLFERQVSKVSFGQTSNESRQAVSGPLSAIHQESGNGREGAGTGLAGSSGSYQITAGFSCACRAGTDRQGTPHGRAPDPAGRFRATKSLYTFEACPPSTRCWCWSWPAASTCWRARTSSRWATSGTGKTHITLGLGMASCQRACRLCRHAPSRQSPAACRYR